MWVLLYENAAVLESGTVRGRKVRGGREMKLLRWLEDQAMRFLQQRCDHPDKMVSVDILEGCGRDLEVQYCNRCGGVMLVWDGVLDLWRRPDPNLWRGL